MALNRRGVLLASLAAMVASVPNATHAEEKLEGNVVHTNLTLCHPRPGGGGCEGTLTLETKAAAGTAERVVIRVIADTIIKRDQDVLFLPATQGNAVLVTYSMEKGQKVAKAINVLGPAR